jgi:hypothetical protein
MRNCEAVRNVACTPQLCLPLPDRPAIRRGRSQQKRGSLAEHAGGGERGLQVR